MTSAASPAVSARVTESSRRDFKACCHRAHAVHRRDEIDAAALAAVDWAFASARTGSAPAWCPKRSSSRTTSGVAWRRCSSSSRRVAGRCSRRSARRARSSRWLRGRGREGRLRRGDGRAAAHARLSEAHLVDHFRALADGDRASRSSCRTPPATSASRSRFRVCVKLLERYGPEKILFKPEAAPNGPNALGTARRDRRHRPRMFEGSGGIFLIDSYRRGIAGTMPGMELLDGVVAVWKALQRGDEDGGVPRVLPGAAPSSRCNCKPGSTASSRSRST